MLSRRLSRAAVPVSPISIYHNPSCGTSRNTLALLRQSGNEPTVIEYLVTPPAREEIADLAARIGLPLRDILRRKGTPFAELGLDDPALGTSHLLDAIEAHPILLNRPIVVGPKGVKLCRPSDVVLDLISERPSSRILKEDGVPVLKDMVISPSYPDLRQELAGAGMSVDDLGEPNRQFFAYDTLDDERVGYAGLERFGQDVFVRSLVVRPGVRRGGIGSNIVPLLLFRAYEAGARRAYLLTTSAAPFFAKLGFKEIGRDKAPADILSTRQAAGLCPASATLMTRKLGF